MEHKQHTFHSIVIEVVTVLLAAITSFPVCDIAGRIKHATIRCSGMLCCPKVPIPFMYLFIGTYNGLEFYFKSKSNDNYSTE